jgi:hypothetical protein
MSACIIFFTVTNFGTIILAYGFYSILSSVVDVNQRVILG